MKEGQSVMKVTTVSRHDYRTSTKLRVGYIRSTIIVSRYAFAEPPLYPLNLDNLPLRLVSNQVTTRRSSTSSPASRYTSTSLSTVRWTLA